MLEKAKTMTIAEMIDGRNFVCAVYGIPEREHKHPVMPFLYEPKHGIDQAKLYDAEIAEIMDDRNAEKARVRNRRKADRKHPENKAERKKEKQNRMHRLYGLAYEDTKYGKTVYFWDKKEGQKKFPEYEAEIFRNLKERSAEKSARADWEIELRNIAEDAERDAIREWERKHAVEQANARAWMAMQNWLEWA